METPDIKAFESSHKWWRSQTQAARTAVAEVSVLRGANRDKPRWERHPIAHIRTLLFRAPLFAALMVMLVRDGDCWAAEAARERIRDSRREEIKAREESKNRGVSKTTTREAQENFGLRPPKKPGGPHDATRSGIIRLDSPNMKGRISLMNQPKGKLESDPQTEKPPLVASPSLLNQSTRKQLPQTWKPNGEELERRDRDSNKHEHAPHHHRETNRLDSARSPADLGSQKTAGDEFKTSK